MGHADTLIAMGGAFLAAAVLARLGGRIGLPTIPLFMLAGIVLGPHTPGFALVRDPDELEMLSGLGLVLLLFYLGLEFHLDDLRSGGRKLLAAGGVYLLLNVGAGLGFGFGLGWGLREALVLAGVIGISSSAIVTKILIDLGRIGRPETRLILGVIVVEDIFLALYLAALQPVLSGASGLGEIAAQSAKAFGFLLFLAVVARYGTRLVGRLMAVRDNELLVISFLGAAVLVAGLSELLGVADAIGAFMVGLILGGTPARDRIRTLVHPLRDAFAAIFFFAFGLAIDPGDVLSVAAPVLIAVLLTVVVNVLAGLYAARLHGYGGGPAANVATTLLARGEFALILAAMAAGAGLDGRLAPFIAGYVLVLAVLGPVVAGHAPRLAAAFTRHRTPGAAPAEQAPGAATEAPAPAPTAEPAAATGPEASAPAADVADAPEPAGAPEPTGTPAPPVAPRRVASGAGHPVRRPAERAGRGVSAKPSRRPAPGGERPPDRPGEPAGAGEGKRRTVIRPARARRRPLPGAGRPPGEDG